MDYKQLSRHIPSISGNIKISVENDDVYLNAIITNDSISISKTYNHNINLENGFSNDLVDFLSNNNWLGVHDEIDYVPEVGKIMSPLLLLKEVPEYFMIFKKKRDSDDDKILIKYYDLTEKTKLGKYLLKHISDIEKEHPIFLNSDKNEVIINAISLQNGYIYDNHMLYDENFNVEELIKEYLKTSKLILPNIINLEFEYSHNEVEEDYDVFGLYCSMIELFEYNIFGEDRIIVNRDNSVTVNDFVIDENDYVGGVSNYPMPLDPNLFYITCIRNGDEIKYLTKKDDNVVLSEKLNLKLFPEVNGEFNHRTSVLPYEVFEYLGGFDQSEYIHISVNGYGVTLISDFMPNLIQAGIPFPPSSNNYNIFNWQGNNEDVMTAICNAWNETSERKTNIRCYVYDGKLFFVSKLNRDFDIIISSDKIVPINTNSNEVNSYDLYEVDKEIKGDLFVKKNNEMFPIIEHFKEIKLINGEIIEGNTIIKIKRNDNKEIIKTLYSLVRPIVGVMSVADTIDPVNRINDVRYNEKDLYSVIKPKKLVINKEYIVIGDNSQIISNGETYENKESFIAFSEEYKVTKGNPRVVLKDYSDDEELVKMINISLDEENYTKTLFSINESNDIGKNYINFVNNLKPNGKVFKQDFYSRNNEWLVPSKKPILNHWHGNADYIDGIYNPMRNLSRVELIDIIGNNFSSFERIGDKYITNFKGSEISSEDNLEGYIFSAIMNIHTDPNYVSGVKFRMVKNNNNKSIIVVMDIPINDYRIKDGFSYCLTYFMNGSKSDVDKYSTNHQLMIAGEQLSVVSNKIPIKIIRYDNRVLTANQEIPLNTLISKRNDGLEMIFCNSNTMISNKIYIDPNGVVTPNHISKISMEGNKLVLGDFMMVSYINGVYYGMAMTTAEISTMVDWDELEVYQIGAIEDNLQNLFKLINFSYIKESINLKKEFIESFEIGDSASNWDYDIKIKEKNKYFSGSYDVNYNVVRTNIGSTTPNVFSVNPNTWKTARNRWVEDRTSINIFDGIFEKQINININE